MKPFVSSSFLAVAFGIGGIAACSSSTTVTSGTPTSVSTADGGGSGGEGGGGGGGDETLATACANEAPESCALYQKCYPLNFELAFGTMDDCVTAESTLCNYDATYPDVGITAGVIRACTASLQGATCEAYQTGNVCPLIDGTRAAGAACEVGTQCTTGYCAGAGAGTCGICVELGDLGAACSVTEPCDYTKSIYCGQAQKCVAYGVAGAACGGTDDPACKSGLVCTNKACGQGAGAGESCSGDVPCDPLGTAQQCDQTTMKCVAYKVGDTGDPCGGTTGVVFCKTGSCKITGSTGTCVADLALGAGVRRGRDPGLRAALYVRRGRQMRAPRDARVQIAKPRDGGLTRESPRLECALPGALKATCVFRAPNSGDKRPEKQRCPRSISSSTMAARLPVGKRHPRRSSNARKSAASAFACTRPPRRSRTRRFARFAAFA